MTRFVCPKCGHVYESPVTVIEVAHRCKKAETGKTRVIVMRAAS